MAEEEPMSARFARSIAFVSVLVVLPRLTGCSDDSEDCEVLNTCNQGAGGQGGGILPGCLPSGLAAGETPSNDCGVFVSSADGNDTNPGTKELPLKTFGAALAKSKPVYACNGAPFDEAITVPAGSILFGGLACGSWTYDATRTVIAPMTPPSLAVVVLDAGTDAELYDIAVHAPDATSAGAHSVAVFANQATATLERCELVAGAGAPGEDGEDGAMLDDDPDNDGAMGSSGTTMPTGLCNAQTHAGGPGGTKTCDGVNVAGGTGGGAFTDPGGSGQEGKLNGFGTEGDGGDGQDLTPPTSCQTGEQGHTGMSGSDGAAGSALGELTESGFTSANGTSGEHGEHGQGGGGGGASACTGGNTGPSGGGGGSGGCGGKGGTGGTAGGSSFAILSFQSTLTIRGSNLQASAGANGGAGGDGQSGGNGGGGGPQAGGACPGGNGGNGGNGGHGGGGRGGHGAAIAFVGPAPELDAQSQATPGAAGDGGLGGGGAAALDGDAGLACANLDLDGGSCR